MSETRTFDCSPALDRRQAQRNTAKSTQVAPVTGPAAIFALQRAAGNAAVKALLTNQAVPAIRQAVSSSPSTSFQRCGAAPYACATEQPTATNDYTLPSDPVQVVQRAPTDPTNTSITPEAAAAMSDAVLKQSIARLQAPATAASGDQGARDNLIVLLEEQRKRLVDHLATAEDINPFAADFAQYGKTMADLLKLGQTPSEDPEGVEVPGDKVLAAGEDASVGLFEGDALQGVDDDLIPMLDNIADAGDSGDPSALGHGAQGQVIAWDDGRAIISPPITADFASIVNRGRPATITNAGQVSAFDRGWRRAADAAGTGVLRSGVAQLGSQPISKFYGTTMPPGTRIRFADPNFGPKAFSGKGSLPKRLSAPGDTRFLTLFDPKSKKFYSWDAHAPVGNQPHAFYHVNQKGWQPLLGASDHSAIPPSMLGGAKGVRWMRVGGRVFLVVGVAIDAALLTQSVIESVEKGTPRPAIAQAVRTIGSWGGAWVGAKLGCRVGAAVSVETGPGMVLGCLVGGVGGGFVGYFIADTIADAIEGQ